MFKWYVLQVLSSQEKKVKRSIEENLAQKGMSDHIDQVILPVENVSEVKGGEQRVVERKLWPGYLLVHMNLTEESWSYVVDNQGVIGFLGGDKPTPLTQAEVDAILQDLEKKRETVTLKYQFKVGDNVKIVDGVFANFSGTVTDVFQQSATLNVLVSIFGRETPVDGLNFAQVEEISED